MSEFSQKRYNLPPGGGPGGLLGRIAAFVIGIGALVVSLVVGAVFIAALFGFLLIVATVIGIRVWWLKRRVERHARESGDIEAEYTVITEDKWTKR